jgi:hypothetical protein
MDDDDLGESLPENEEYWGLSTYCPATVVHTFPNAAHPSRLSMLPTSQPVLFPNIGTSFAWSGFSNCNTPTPMPTPDETPDVVAPLLLQPADPSTDVPPSVPASPMSTLRRTPGEKPAVDVTDDDMDGMSLYSSPGVGMPRNEHLVSVVL